MTTGHACKTRGNPFLAGGCCLYHWSQGQQVTVRLPFRAASGELVCELWATNTHASLWWETLGDHQVGSLQCPELRAQRTGKATQVPLQSFQNGFKNTSCIHHWENKQGHVFKSIHSLVRACYLNVVTQDKPSLKMP